MARKDDIPETLAELLVTHDVATSTPHEWFEVAHGQLDADGVARAMTGVESDGVVERSRQLFAPMSPRRARAMRRRIVNASSSPRSSRWWWGAGALLVAALTVLVVGYRAADGLAPPAFSVKYHPILSPRSHSRRAVGPMGSTLDIHGYWVDEPIEITLSPYAPSDGLDVQVMVFGYDDRGHQRLLLAARERHTPPPSGAIRVSLVPETMGLDPGRWTLRVVVGLPGHTPMNPSLFAPGKVIPADAPFTIEDVQIDLDRRQPRTPIPTRRRAPTTPLLVAEYREQLNRRWCSAINHPLREMYQRYPFSDSETSFSRAMVANMFRPRTGRVPRFHWDLLGWIQLRDGEHVLLDESGEVVAAINPAVIRFLDRAQDITTSMFTEGGTLKYELDVRLEDAHSLRDAMASLEVDGLPVRSAKGAQSWTRLVWPQQGALEARLSVSIGARSASVEGKGDWALFRLFEAAEVTADPDLEVFRVSWDLRDRNLGIVTALVRPGREGAGLLGAGARDGKFLDLFRHPDLTPPRQLFEGGPACPR